MSRRRISITTALKQRIPKGGRVLVAVSGGCDSIALLDGLLRVKRLLEVHVEVCHVDHGVREESAADAAFVVGVCQQYDVSCHVVKLPIKPAGENLERWARENRYRVFSEVMKERSLDLVATAHTANDVAETLMMRLLANKELTSIQEYDPRRRCIRPLIDISREQVEQYVSRYHLAWREDPSNEQVEFVRNRIRHEVLPLLKDRFDPSMVWILSERARSLAADSDALHGIAGEVAMRIGPVEEQSVNWLHRCRSALEGQPWAVQWRTVQALFVPLFGFTVGEARAETLLKVILGGASTVSIDGTREVRCGAGGLKVTQN